VRTKAEAADTVGLSRGYFYAMTSPAIGNEETVRLHDEVDELLKDKTVDMSRVLALVAREAVGKLRKLMQEGGSEGIQLKASQDLADRSPDTSKTLKATVAHINLSGSDAKGLAEAMVASAKAKQQYAEVALGDTIKVPLEDPEAGLKLIRDSADNGSGSSESS